MTTAKVVKAWRGVEAAYLAVRVAEAEGDVEYIGAVPVDELAGLGAAEQRAALVAAVKAVRDRQMGVTVDVSGFGATVSI